MLRLHVCRPRPFPIQAHHGTERPPNARIFVLRRHARISLAIWLRVLRCVLRNAHRLVSSRTGLHYGSAA